jgi:hypothetical protein
MGGVRLPAGVAISTILALAIATARAEDREGPRCRTEEGIVLSYRRIVQREGCRDPVQVVSAKLYQGDRLRTLRFGKLQFSTVHLNLCRMMKRSRDVILPSSDIALSHEAGEIWCYVMPSATRPTKLSVPGCRNLPQGCVIRVTGSVFGIETTPRGTGLKIALGNALLQAFGKEVPAKFQLFVPRGGLPGDTQRFEPTREESEAIILLQLVVVSAPAPQVLTFLKQTDQRAAALIGQNAQTLNRTRKQLVGLRLTEFTRDEFLRSSDAAAARIRAEGLRTAIVAGRLDTMTPVLRELRTRVPLLAIRFITP